MKAPMSRRSAIRKIAGTAAAATAAAAVLPNLSRAEDAAPAKLKGPINHSACRWCYGKVSLDDLCKAGKEMGMVAVDLLNPNEFATVKTYGLVCSMVFNPVIDGLRGIHKAWNRIIHYVMLVQAYE